MHLNTEITVCLVPVNRESITEYVHLFDDAIIKFFPLLRFKNFYRFLRSLYLIKHEDLIKGLILLSNPQKEYSSIGLYEASIIIFPEYRHKGIGTEAIGELQKIGKNTFLKVRHDNTMALKFFNGIPILAILKTEANFTFYTFNNELVQTK